MTSVKDIHIERSPTTDELGVGSFVFTDDYSVFDWGKMPDQIPRKGASLCVMGANNFERLEAAGIPTHYRGVVTDTDPIQLPKATTPPRELAIDLTQVPDLPVADDGYDYAAYHAAAGENYLIPLEIVFRNTVPVGSSLRRRTAPPDHDLSFTEWPDEPIALDEPIVEFSTKYEEQDRYLDRAAAQRIAGTADLGELEDVARDVNDLITERARSIGLTHQDGKIECLYYQGEIRVADVVGTFDENRFAFNDQQVSKEVLRQYYKEHHPDWVDAVSAAKTAASDQGIAAWKSLCDREPPALPPDVITAASDLYAAGANAYCDRAWFEAPSLAEAVERIHTL